MRALIAALVLVIIGCARMAADLGGIDALEAAADATQASPAMKLFTSHEEHETFSQFEIHYRSVDGEARTLPLTPAQFSRLEGPYNRRSAYSAALTYSPGMMGSPAMSGIVDAVVRYGFCDPGPLLEELRLADLDTHTPLSVVITPRQHPDPSRVLRFEVSCGQ